MPLDGVEPVAPASRRSAWRGTIQRGPPYQLNWSRALATAAALAIAIVLLYIRPTRLAVETHTIPPSAPQTTPFTASTNITPATPSTHQLTSSRPRPSAHRAA